jgi:hypothetical protein
MSFDPLPYFEAARAHRSWFGASLPLPQSPHPPTPLAVWCRARTDPLLLSPPVRKAPPEPPFTVFFLHYQLHSARAFNSFPFTPLTSSPRRLIGAPPTPPDLAATPLPLSSFGELHLFPLFFHCISLPLGSPVLQVLVTTTALHQSSPTPPETSLPSPTFLPVRSEHRLHAVFLRMELPLTPSSLHSAIGAQPKSPPATTRLTAVELHRSGPFSPRPRRPSPG